MAFDTRLFDDRIIIQRTERTADGRGSWTNTWSLVARIKAAIQPISSKDRIEYAKANRQVSHKIYVATKQAGISNLSQTIQSGESLRVMFIRGGVTKYFMIVGARDFDESRWITEIEALETDATITNKA